MIHAPDPGVFSTPSESGLDRTPGNQLFLFFLSAVLGGLASPARFDRNLPSIGLDAAREASTGTPRPVGGCAETLRPRGLGDGDGLRGWRRFGCSLATDGGRSTEGLLSRGRVAAGGVACVAVTAGTRGGVPFFAAVGGAGGGGGGDKGIVGAFCSFFRPGDSDSGFSQNGGA